MVRGERVALGPLVQGDGPLLFQWANDPLIAVANGCWRPVDGMDFTAWFQAIGKDAGRVTFAIRPAGETRLAGYLSIMAIHSVFRSAEMGITLGAEDRGRGWGREAMGLGLRYCWQALGLERVTLRIYGDNPAAIRCYQGAGFAIEGVLRGAAYLGGQRMDVTLMGTLREARGNLDREERGK